MTASNPMIMFLVLNTSGLTLIPISIMVYRAQMGAAQPTDIFIPILLATFFSTLAGIIFTSLYQKINLLNRTMLLTGRHHLGLRTDGFHPDEQGEYLVCQYHADDDYHRLHPRWCAEESKCV